MADTRFHSPDDVRDSIESLTSAHGNSRPIMYWFLLLITTLAIAALPLTKVDMSVGAPGQIRPAVERLPVHPAVAGRISQLLIADNQSVQAGDPLLVIESPALSARIERNDTELAINSRSLADLRVLLDSELWDSYLSEPTDIGQAPTKPLTSDSLDLSTAQYIRQHALLRSDLDRLSLQRTQAAHELTRAENLHRQNLITDQELEQHHYACRSLDGDIRLTIQSRLSQWQSDLVERDLRQSALKSEREQLDVQAALHTVRAPIAGTAIGFNGLHPGLFLLAEQRIGEISPSGDLQADVYLSPRDIGFITAGQPVNLQIDAFPYTEWGTIPGDVRSVSQDFVQVGQQLVFKAVIDLQDTSLTSSSGAEVGLRRGMTIQARFVLQRRTLFDVLFGKMSESLDPRSAVRS
jgi:membrane fusion protein, peptide pheromone/bacteriocin exporter